MILDSNLIIYSAQPAHAQLRALIAKYSPSVSAISVVEVLGFHRITPKDKNLFEEFFRAAEVLPIDNKVIEQAISLRQRRKMSLGDSLIAASAIVFQKKLLTNNEADFHSITELQILNPLKAITP